MKSNSSKKKRGRPRQILRLPGKFSISTQDSPAVALSSRIGSTIVGGGSAFLFPICAQKSQRHLRKFLGILGVEEGKQTSIRQNPKIRAGNEVEQVNGHLHGNEVVPVALDDQGPGRNGGEIGRG
jgi:hypothetical protein